MIWGLAAVLLAVTAAAVLLFFILYRRFPLHLIYRSKINLESMLDAIGDPLAVIDNGYIVQRANKAYISLIKMSFADTIGRPCHLLLRNRDKPCDDCRLSESLKTNQPRFVDRSAHPSGGTISISFSPCTGVRSDERMCVIEHIRDITALEQLKLDLEQKNRSLASTMRTLKAAQQNIKDELRLAQQIQQGILPKSAPNFDGLKIDVIYHPVADVGGDIYDFIPFSEDRLGVFIGDASGHGLSSAFVGTISKMSLYNNSKADIPPGELLVRINSDLINNVHTSHYLTSCWGIFDLKKNLYVYSRAGHPNPVVVRRNGQTFSLPGAGTFLGIVDTAVFEQQEFTFVNGDRIFLFTDGIYEVLKRSNRNDDPLGYDRFVRILSASGEFPFSKLIPGIQRQLSHFTYEDDYTLIAIEVTGR